MKNRIFILFLSVCLLASATLLFASCSKAEVDLTNYSIVYGDDVSNTFLGRINDFVKTFGKAVGGSPEAVLDKETQTVKNSNFEILIGNTSREETAKALELIEGDGYCIAVIDDKIVIVGTTNLLTGKALDLFVETYLNDTEADLSVLKMEKETVVSNIPLLQVNADWSMIYSIRLDDSSTDAKGDRLDPENPNGYDYPVLVCHQLCEYFSDLTVLKKKDIYMAPDSKSYTNEIIVGTTTHREGIDFMATMNVDEYGVGIKDGKVVVAALNENMLRKAAALFKDVIYDSKKVDPDNENEYIICFPDEYSIVLSEKTGWRVDFPKPEGDQIILTGSVNVHDDSVEYYYTGSGISSSAFAAYCQKLESGNYKLHMSNTIEENVFKTYYNTSKGVMLHVIYAPYIHAAEQKVEMFVPSFRIISSKLSSVNMVPQELLNSKQTYTKRSDTRITAVRLDYNGGENYGNSYVMTLEDGTFIVFDGGGFVSSDADRLYAVLSDLYRSIYGRLPTASNRIKITAWYMTHGHADHYYAFSTFCNKYGGLTDLDYVIANFPSEQETYNSFDPNNTVRDGLKSMLSKLGGQKMYIKVHAGQKFFIRNVELEVLYTHEEMYPWNIEIFNDTSTVIRMSIRNTDGQGNLNSDREYSFLWLGDLQTRGSRTLRAMYGDYLQSDMVQVSHHGGNGCEWALYQLVAPEYVWWPHRLSYFSEMDSGRESNVTYIKTSYKVINELPSVKYFILSDNYNVTMTITADGPDMRFVGESSTGLYNAAEQIGTPLLAYGDAVIAKNRSY